MTDTPPLIWQEKWGVGGEAQKRESRHQKVASSSYCMQTARGKPSGLSTNEEESREAGLFLHQLLVREGAE